MALRQIHVGLSTAQTKMLERLAAKLGLDKSSAIRYCISRIAEQEGVMESARSGRSSSGGEDEPRRSTGR